MGRGSSPIHAAEPTSRPQAGRSDSTPPQLGPPGRLSTQVDRVTNWWRSRNGTVDSPPPRTGDTPASPPARDPLTGLATRDALLRRIEDEIAGRVSLGNGTRAFALLLLELDRFTEVNDVLGRRVGNPLLVEFGHRLATAVPADALAARLGGDQFAVLLPHAHTPAAAQAQATEIAAAVAGPVYLDDMPLEVATSSGIAMHPRHGVDADGLLQRATIAAGQTLSRDTTAVYAPDSAQYDPDQFRMVSDLRRALDQSSGIDLYYQPQVAVASGELVGVEALLRWKRPEHGIVDPETVIRAIEHTTVMRLLTYHVLEKAIAQLADWSRAGMPLRVSVNVSAHDLHDATFGDHVADRLHAWHVDPAQLQLEVTEGALLDDTRRIRDTLRQLGSTGVALSLDDFGTGYASMLRLRRLPLSEIKVDRSFVTGMASDDSDAAIVQSIIDLGTACRLRVVAEGVEDEPTCRQLAAQGCHVAQGWHYGHPMSASEATTWIARRARESHAAVGDGSGHGL